MGAIITMNNEVGMADMGIWPAEGFGVGKLWPMGQPASFCMVYKLRIIFADVLVLSLMIGVPTMNPH